MSPTQPTTTTVTTDDGELPVHVWTPESGRGPGVVLVQEIFGVSAYIRRRAAALAEAGYVVWAPEVYWRLGSTAVDESSPTALEDAVALAGQVDWEQAVSDVTATLEALGLDEHVSGGVGLVGFCFGGGLAFNVAAVAEPDALVSYYGSSLPQLLDLAPRVRMPSLHHVGTADSYLDPETVARIETAVSADGAPVEFHHYDGADHAFDNDDFVLHHPEASVLAWQRTLDFLARQLPL